uniref:Uncharacterized protein n=1 Tax=Chrysemys picta bellii TaxID=8478 RepID=A0A8C3PF35_CHRPI
MRVKVCSFIIPWFHFFLLQLCVQRLGSLLPVKIPILSSVLVLQGSAQSPVAPPSPEAAGTWCWPLPGTAWRGLGPGQAGSLPWSHCTLLPLWSCSR